MAPLFDTHVHLDASPLCHDLQGVAARAVAAQVTGFVVPGVRSAGWAGVLAAARAVPGAYAAPGLHPLAALEWDDGTAARLSALLRDPVVAAVGEIGLDALLPAPSLTVQEAALRGQLRLAVEAGLPVLIHCRKATGRLLAILREEEARRVGGILHAFSGSVETALEAIRLGFAIGIGGPVTFPGARRLPEVLRRLPAEAVVLETDAPDLPPVPYRGECNQPVYLPLVAERVAELRGWSLEETAHFTTANARRTLRLDG